MIGRSESRETMASLEAFRRACAEKTREERREAWRTSRESSLGVGALQADAPAPAPRRSVVADDVNVHGMLDEATESAVPVAMAHEMAGGLPLAAVAGHEVTEQAVANGTAEVEAASNVEAAVEAADVVQGAAQRRDQLVSKMFVHGGCRPTEKMTGLLPHGGGGLKTKVPKRREYGAEGDDGDAAHAAAMKQFSVKEWFCVVVVLVFLTGYAK